MTEGAAPERYTLTEQDRDEIATLRDLPDAVWRDEVADYLGDPATGERDHAVMRSDELIERLEEALEYLDRLTGEALEDLAAERRRGSSAWKTARRTRALIAAERVVIRPMIGDLRNRRVAGRKWDRERLVLEELARRYPTEVAAIRRAMRET